MPPESKAPRALTIEKLSIILDTKLEDEGLVLGGMIQALSKNELPPETWGRLHEAAQRDDRLLELASAYEEQCNPRMIRRLTGAQQAELLMHAADFAHKTLEDAEGAIAYLERAVGQDPSNTAAFDMLENLLIEAANGAKLIDLYVSIAGHQSARDEQIRLLKRAAELSEVFAEEPPKVITIHEKLLRLDPGDGEARKALEGLYRRASRWSELAKLLEQGVSAGDDREGRARLIELYLTELSQPDRAVGHVEELLKLEPASDAGREGARKLMQHKLLGARAALALEGALDKTGELDEVVKVLGALIEATRGPQRTEAQKRLGRALLRSGNEAEAFAALEKVVAVDAADDELRGSYRQAGEALGRSGDVAKVLLRAASTTKNDALKARLNLEAAEALLSSGDPKRARASLQAASEGGDAAVQVEALRRLEPLVGDEPRALIEVLERLVQADAEGRAEASLRLGDALKAQGEDRRAIKAYQGALAGASRRRAEGQLEELYERAGAWAELVALLEEQGGRGDGDAARLSRAALLRSERLSDVDGALGAWAKIAARFGRSPEVTQRRRELLERARRHGELVAELIEESATGSKEARGGLWGLVAQLRLERLNDAAGALVACREALALLPGEPKASAAAAQLFASPEHQLAAAEALEPVYREQADFWGLVRALEVRGRGAPDPKARLSALGEAVELVASDDPKRALTMATEGLRQAVEHDLGAVSDWLVRMELLSGATEGPAEHASLLLSALGGRGLDHPGLVDLARRAASSLIEGGKAQEGLALLGRVFAADPSKIEGAPGVDRALGAQGDAGARVALWGLVLEHEKAADRRAEVLRQVATLERQRGDLGASEKALRGVLELAPGDLGSWSALAEALRAQGKLAELLDLLVQRLARSEGAEDEVQVLLSLADVAVRLSRVDVFDEASGKARFARSDEQQKKVLAARARVLGADPQQRAKAAEAHRALIEASKGAEAIEAFEAFLASVPRDERHRDDLRWLRSWQAEHASDRVAALLAWAHEEEETLGDDRAAVELYRRILVLDAACDEAQRKLPPLLLRLGDVEGARGALLAQRARASGAERRALDLSLASLLIEKAGRHDEGLGALWPLLEASPIDADALRIVGVVLERATGEADAQARRSALSALDRAAAATKDEAQARSLLSVLLSAGGDAEQRKGWHRELLRRLEGDPEQALPAVLRAIEEDPLDSELWDQAEQLARRVDRATEVLDAYRQHLGTPGVAAAIGQRAIDFYEEWFEDPEGVVALVERVLIADVGAQWAFDRLKVFYGADERWGELLSLYDRMVDAARSDGDRIVFLEDAAQIAKDFASDDARAIGYLERLSGLKQGDESIEASLERLYERTGRHTALIDLLTRRLERLDVPEGQRLRARIAALWLDGVGDVGSTFAVLSQMFALNPAEPEAFALLERLLSTFKRSTPHEAESPAAQAYQKAASILKSRYEEAGRHEDLVRVLEVELTAIAEPGARAQALRGLIDLRLSRLSDTEGAFDNALELASDLPGDEGALALLDGLAGRLGAHERHAAFLSGQASARQGAVAARLWLTAARVAAGKLGDARRAADWYRSAVAQRGDAGAVGDALAAARELCALLESKKDAALFEALADRAALEPEAGGRREVIAAMAALARGQGDPARVVQAWRLRLEDDALDVEALSGLIDAYRSLGRWPELVATLRSRASVAEPGARRADLREAARVLGERLSDDEGALSIWQEIRRGEGDDDETTDASADLLSRLGRFDDLAELLAGQIQAAGGAARKAELLRSLGDVERGPRDNPAAAVEAYRKALIEEAGCEPALQGLWALVEGDRARAAAVQALLDHFRRGEDWKGVAGLCELRLGLAEDSETQALILMETASLLEEKLSDVGGAFEALRRALALAPGDLSLAKDCLRAALAAGREAEGLSALREATRSPAAPRKALWVTLAEAQLASDAPAADEAYEQALAEGEDAALLRSLVDLRRKSRGRPLAEALLRLARAEGGSPSLTLEAARVALDELGDIEQARALARRLLASASAGELPREQLAEAADWSLGVLTAEGPAQVDAPERAALLLSAVELPREDGRRVELLRRHAELAEEALQDLDGAVESYRRLLALAPADLPALGRLSQLYRRLGRRSDLLATLGRQIEAQPDAQERSTLRLDLALLLRDTGEADAAIQALQQALADTPGRREIVAQLEQLYEATGRGRDLVALIEREAARRAEAGEDDAGEQWARAASLWEGRLSDTAQAVAAHRKAVALGRRASLEALARLLLQRREYLDAASVLEQIAAQASGQELVSAWTRLAEAYTSAGRKEEARRVLEQAVAIAEDPTPLQSRLVELYREAGDWSRLADMMVAEAQGTRDPKQRAARLREAAELLLSRKGDAAAASALLKEAAELSPDDVLTQLAYGESLRHAGRLDEALSVLRRLVESYGSRRPKDRALAHLQLGLVLHAAGDRPAALAELDAASRIDPAHPRILQALGQVAFEEGELERAQKALRSLLLLLPRGARADHGVSRVDVQLGLADIARRQGDQARADELIESAFAHAREHEAELSTLEGGLRSRELWAPLLRALDMRLAGAEAGAQPALLRELASLHRRLDQHAEAFERLRRALPFAFDQADLLRDLTDAARAAQAIQALHGDLAAQAQALEASAPEASVALLLSAARLAEEDLQDDATALASLARAEALTAAQGAAEAALRGVWQRTEAILLRKGDRDAMIALLRRRRDFTAQHSPSPAAKAEPLFRLAELLLTPPSDPAEALGHLEQALALDPQIERAADLIEQATAQHGDSEHVLRFHERFCREHGRTASLVEALRRLGALPSVGTAPLREAAELSMQSGDEETADAVLREISELDQSSTSLPDVIWALTTLAARLEGRGSLGLSASLKERAAEIAPPEQRRALLLEVATLSRGPLQDDARAARLLASVLEQHPGDPEAFRPLLELYRGGDDPRLASLLESLLPVVDGDTRQGLRADLIAALLRPPPRPEAQRRAIDLLHETIEEHPEDEQSSQTLADLLEQGGELPRLADLLERRLSASRERGDDEATASVALRLGALYEQLRDDRKAHEVYRFGLDRAPRNNLLLRALLAVAERRDDAAEIADVLERLLAAETDHKAAEIALRLASLHEANWNPEAAERALEQGYAVHPDNALRDQLIERYTDGSSWAKLAALHARDASVQQTPGAKVNALRKAADVQRKHLADPAAAADLLQQALSLAPTDRQLLTSLLLSLTAAASPANTRRAIDAISFALERRPADPELLCLRGERHAELDAFDAAIADLEASSAAGHPTAPSALLSALRRAIPAARGAAAQRPLRLRAAALLAAAGEADGARSLLDDAARAEPGNAEVLRAQADLERKAQRWEAAVAPLKALAASAEGPALVELALALSETAERAQKIGEAQKALERALQAEPKNKTLRARLKATYEQTGARREQALLLREEASLTAEPGPRFEALLSAARLLLDPQSGDPKLATQTLEEARALRPDDLELAMLLADTQVALRRPREAIQVLDRVVVAHRGKRSKLLGQVFQRKAQLELGLGERPAALISLGKAFENDGSNGPLAMELGLLALELNDEQVAGRAFRAISLMKTVSGPSEDGTTAAAKAQAYYQLSLLALGQADRRKARLLAEKAVSEDPSLEPARQLRDELKNG